MISIAEQMRIANEWQARVAAMSPHARRELRGRAHRIFWTSEDPEARAHAWEAMQAIERSERRR